MYESVNIIFQTIANLTITRFENSSSSSFSFLTFVETIRKHKFNRQTKYNSMESLITHFKMHSEGLRPRAGFVFQSIEAPKGEFGVSLISDGSGNPYRCKIRTPAFHHIQVMPRLAQGHLFADLITILGSQDIVFGDVDR
jgi:NADH:ubiquinone oxidoreductase subunit D